MNFEEARKIPGMIEPIEQQLLFDLASNVKLQPHQTIVEFGTFFGRSTNCLAQGLAKNASRHPTNHILAYDSFQCAYTVGLVDYLTKSNKQDNSEQLLKIDNDILDFKSVFEYYSASYIRSGLVKPVQSELRNSLPPDGDIALMHI